MLSRMNMEIQVSEKHGEILSLLDRLADISFVRVRSHFKHAWRLSEKRKEIDPPEPNWGANFLIGANFLAERACYTAEAISCCDGPGHTSPAGRERSLQSDRPPRESTRSRS